MMDPVLLTETVSPLVWVLVGKVGAKCGRVQYVKVIEDGRVRAEEFQPMHFISERWVASHISLQNKMQAIGKSSQFGFAAHMQNICYTPTAPPVAVH